MLRHELPTHLDVPDRAMFGLTMRQVLTLAAGLALAYAAATAPALPLPLAVAGSATVLAGALMATLWQPAGRPLEVWAAVLLAYAATPRIAIWRPALPVTTPLVSEPATVVVRLSARKGRTDHA